MSKEQCAYCRKVTSTTNSPNDCEGYFISAKNLEEYDGKELNAYKLKYKYGAISAFKCPNCHQITNIDTSYWDKTNVIPNFGVHKVEHAGIELECGYYVPGLTLQDLCEIYHKALDGKYYNILAGNPSEWPDTIKVKAVVDAVLNAIYIRKN